MTAPATAPARTQSCGHCSQPVPATSGRIPGRTWWCSTDRCQRARVVATSTRYRANHTEGVRKVGRCEHCKGPVQIRPDITSLAGRFCSRPACDAERNRRLAHMRRPPLPPQPCPGCGTLVPPGRNRREGRRWWCTRACRGEAATRRVTVVIAPEIGADAHGPLIPAGPAWQLVHGIIARGWTREWIAAQLTGHAGSHLMLGDVCTARTWARLRAAADYAALTAGPSAHSRREATRNGWKADWLWDDLGQGDDQPEDQPIPFRR